MPSIGRGCSCFAFILRQLSKGYMDERPELWGLLNSFIKMHASYHSIYKEVVNLLFYGDGPLPFYCRHYLAIMAASRHKCHYLMSVHKEEFLNYAGPPTWLDGLEHASQKIRDIDLTNRLLAHRPWLLQVAHLQKLSSSPNNWSLSEMVQGALILSHTHALCSFINGCGFSNRSGGPEPPLPLKTFNSGGTRATGRSASGDMPSTMASINGRPPSLATPAIFGGVADGGRRRTSSPLRKTLAPSENSTAKNFAPAVIQGAKTNGALDKVEPKSQLAKCKSFEAGRTNGQGDNVEKLMACMQVLAEAGSHRSREDMLSNFWAINRQNCEINSDCFKDGENFSVVSYTEDSDFAYSEFFRKTDGLAPPIFSIHEYSWNDHGYSVVSELYSTISDVMDDKFKLIQDLTYHCMGGHKNVDTTKYRTAVWNYIQTLFGIRHDDYDYSEINKLLSRPMKSYIKTLCCYPDRMKNSLRDNVMLDFLQSEKVHVNLLIFEARFQAESLYLLRTMLRFLTEKSFAVQLGY